jgi:hypothetical protein
MIFKKWAAKWTRFEYWPWWFFYLPLIPLHIYYAIRSKSLVYFSAVNPGIEYGGFFGEKKNEILDKIHLKYKPFTLYFLFNKRDNWNDLLLQVRSYPVIFKPNVGERGDDVAKFDTSQQLQAHIGNVHYDFIIQEYIDYPIELGVLYYRMPLSKNGVVCSLTLKNFLKVLGNGKSTVKELLAESRRGMLQIERLEKTKPQLLSFSPAQGEEILVEGIGNHCLGTEFIDANKYLGDDVNRVFDEIARDFEGFYYGRFDLRIPNWEALKTGKGIKIFELNGVSSEPGHMYDAKHRFWYAYKIVASMWEILFLIAKQNRQLGVPYASASEILKKSMQHFFVAKR